MDTETLRSARSHARYQLLFSGGYGGLVTYDGKGGKIFKDGAPIDRLHVIRPMDELEELGLAIFNGVMIFTSGSLAGPVSVANPSEELQTDTRIIFQFDGNDQADAVRIVGQVPAIGLRKGTVLFSGSLSAFRMLYNVGDITGRIPSAPLLAEIPKFTIHSAILDWCKLPPNPTGTALAGWQKPTNKLTSDEAKEVLRTQLTESGVPLSTQQEVGYIQVLLH